MSDGWIGGQRCHQLIERNRNCETQYELIPVGGGISRPLLPVDNNPTVSKARKEKKAIQA